jgi:hypothetical protein
MNKPLLIVLTPVRNEAWILHAFLKATSLWADYIIIADQMSTDGSRNIYPQYEKVILIDNPRAEMHQARTRQLLFEAAKKIEGDKILFALDADEFLSGDFINTPSWQTILNSEPGDVFLFRWINLLPDTHKYMTHIPYYWAVHMSDNVMNGQFPDNHIHEWRLPWPSVVNKEYVIEDISFIHFARVNDKRQKNKEIFYQVSTAYKEDSYSGIKLFRHYQTYKPIKDSDVYDLPVDMYDFYHNHQLDLMSEINLVDIGQHYIDAVKEMFNVKGIKHFTKLDIWSDDFIEILDLHIDPRSFIDKIVIAYLKLTKRYANTILVKVVDKLLKRIY